MSTVLSPRLMLVASYAQEYRRIADIGSDHALLPLYLLQANKIDYALCVEVATGPYKINRSALMNYIDQGKADAILSFGIDDIEPDIVDAIVIAGMGGLTIIEILKRRLDKAKAFDRLILQPQNAQSEVRKFLIENQFKITDEAIAREKNKFYEVICAAYSSTPVAQRKEIYYEIPLLCIKNGLPHTLDFISHKQKILKNILRQTETSANPKAHQARQEAMQKYKELEEVKKCLSK